MVERRCSASQADRLPSHLGIHSKAVVGRLESTDSNGRVSGLMQRNNEQPLCATFLMENGD